MKYIEETHDWQTLEERWKWVECQRRSRRTNELLELGCRLVYEDLLIEG
jgi:hypothetical protein